MRILPQAHTPLQVITQGFGRHFWDLPLSVTTGDSFIKVRYAFSYTFATVSNVVAFSSITSSNGSHAYPTCSSN